MPIDLPQARKRILVVDDERIIADTLVTILKQNGFDATVAYSGEQAVELAHGLEPALVLSDVIMGPLNGIDAAILIVRSQPGCKILLFSGQPAVAEMLDTAARNGHRFDILAKPVHPDTILRQVRSLVH